AYGSYVPDKSNLVKSINQIEFFDTAVAFLAGVMIIPAVYVFMGPEGMSTGPSLMFVSLPKVFLAMGPVGNVVGTVFFAMVLFAAVTSGMSLMEAVVSSLVDGFGLSRTKATVIESVLALVVGLIVCFGYNIFYFEYQLPNGSTAQILDIFDYVSNNILMPILAIATCILIGWVVKPDTVINEITKNGEKFGRKYLFIAMVKVVAPVCLLFLLLMSLGIIK
ncbi:MAG TPA: sodium-dependent transporter, partial [Clostridiales bacterium]|nr:sodium-dependent transporter [Clostridiales bacterium]